MVNHKQKHKTSSNQLTVDDDPNREANNSFFAVSFHEVSGYGAIKDTNFGCTW